MSEPTPVTVDRPLDPYTMTVIDEVIVSHIMHTRWANEANLLKRVRAAITALEPTSYEIPETGGSES